MVSIGLADHPSEREQYTVLCYSRKELCENIELLCEHAGVRPDPENDVLLRFI